MISVWMSMIDNCSVQGSLTVTMTALTANTAVTEVLVRYEDGCVYVACLLADDTVRLCPATLADLERLPLLEGEQDTESGGEDEIAAILHVAVPLPLAA